jgi:hypothetical protein
MKIEELTVMSYLLNKERWILLERRSFPPDPETWAIKDGGYCLNREGEFEYEPLPSDRDDAFLARCRWRTVAEALEAWEKFCA